MDNKDIEQKVIESNQHDEKMMILVYAQWCINNGFDPEELYKQAYPYQPNNNALTDALELTVPKKESDEIPSQAVLNVLQLFGNDDLAFIVQEQIDNSKESKE